MISSTFLVIGRPEQGASLTSKFLVEFLVVIENLEPALCYTY